MVGSTGRASPRSLGRRCRIAPVRVVAEVVVRLVELIEVVGFQCEGSDDRISEFELKLMQIESEHMEIPEQPGPRQTGETCS